jgi:tRNA-Thr(GGU) m(6)t(6)A37 methyltransferase TsaA
VSGRPRPVELRPIGVVDSPLTDPRRAPRQGDEGAPNAWLILDPELAPALEGIRVGDDLIVLTWFDRADRRILRTRPRDDAARDEQGVFSTRSPDRPNPIGVHEVTVLAIDGARLRVDRMDAIDLTPIIDIKPVLPPMPDR